MIGTILKKATKIRLKEIKLAGGLTFVQDNSAKFGSMPKSATAEGVVDYVLSPSKISEELVKISKDFTQNELGLIRDKIS